MILCMQLIAHAEIDRHLFILLFSFQFSFFFWSKPGLFLLFFFAFISFALITHICLTFTENDSYFLLCPRRAYL
jgi:hypothetical protein